MADEQQQEGQKTLVAFIVGLLIGGMLVWAFSSPTADAPSNTSDKQDEKTQAEVKGEDSEGTVDGQGAEAISAVTEVEKAVLAVGEGKVVVPDQKAAATVKLDSATYPVSEGWIGVREYTNDQLGYILGVVRFSESQGLVPSEIILQRATTAGKQYAVVIYKEDGDRKFNLAGDVQIDQIYDTFKAE